MTSPWLRAVLILLVASSLSIGAQSTGNVMGRVICADSRTPCRYAGVTIETAPPRKDLASPAGTKPPTHSYAAATDLDGTFTMKNVVPGEYYITAIEAGYLSPYDLAMNEVNGDTSLKVQAVDIALERVSVQAGQTATANVQLSRGASLSGTVRYEDGGPAIQVSVELLRKDGAGKWQPYINSSGIGDLARLGFGPKTDDRGRFYAPGLPPGTYALRMSLPEAAMLLSNITGAEHSVDIKITKGEALRVFYGDVYRLKDVKVIELHEGEERTGLDIDIPTSGMYSLRGVVTPKQDAPDALSGKVKLLDPDDKNVLREALLDADGAFTFENVIKGSYLVQVEGEDTSHSKPPGINYEPLLVPLLVQSNIQNLTYALKAVRK